MFPIEVGSDGDSLSGGAAAAITIFLLLVIAIAVCTGIIIILFYHYKQKRQENQVSSFGKAQDTQYACSHYNIVYYFSQIIIFTFYSQLQRPITACLLLIHRRLTH